jgi:hypothetical protein
MLTNDAGKKRPRSDSTSMVRRTLFSPNNVPKSKRNTEPQTPSWRVGSQIFSSPGTPFRPVKQVLGSPSVHSDWSDLTPAAKRARIQLFSSPVGQEWNVPQTELLDLPDELVEMILKCCDSLNEVLQSCQRIYHIGLPIIYNRPKFHSSIQRLDAFLTSLHDAALSDKANLVRRLNLASFEGLSEHHITQLSICSRLKRLDLTGAHVSGQAIEQVVQSNSLTLQRLNLAKCMGVTPEILVHIAQRLGMMHSGLQALDLTRLSLTDGAIEQVATHCHSLRKLKMPRCTGLTEQAVRNALRLRYRSLVTLDVSGMENVGIGIVANLAVGKRHALHRLRHVNMSGVTLASNHNLCVLMDDDDMLLKEEGPKRPISVHNTSLRILHLSSLDFVTPKLLYLVCKHNPKLKSLHLSRCPNLAGLQTELSMDEMRCVIQVFNNLTTLSLAMTPIPMGLVARLAGSRIENLDLSHQPELQDHHIQALMVASHALKRLHLSHNSGLSDGSLYALMALQHQLQRLNIRMCPRMTMLGVRALLNVCRGLEHVNLGGLDCDNHVRYGLERISGHDSFDWEHLVLMGGDIDLARRLLNDVALWTVDTFETTSSHDEEESSSMRRTFSTSYLNFVDGLVPASISHGPRRRSSGSSAGDSSILSGDDDYKADKSAVTSRASPEPAPLMYSFLDGREDPMSGFFFDSEEEDSSDSEEEDSGEVIQHDALSQDILDVLSSDFGWDE